MKKKMMMIITTIVVVVKILATEIKSIYKFK